MASRLYRLWPPLLLVVLAGLVAAACETPAGPALASPAAGSMAGTPLAMPGVVTYVADGDTLTIRRSDDTTTRIRLLGIDAPEIAHDGRPADCGGDEAAASLKTLLPPGIFVQAVTDPVSDTWDVYGRLLAYVSAPGIPDVGLAQIQGGYAEAWIPAGQTPPARYISYQQTETTAQQQSAGAWASCATLGRQP